MEFKKPLFNACLLILLLHISLVSITFTLQDPHHTQLSYNQLNRTPDGSIQPLQNRDSSSHHIQRLKSELQSSAARATASKFESRVVATTTKASPIFVTQGLSSSILSTYVPLASVWKKKRLGFNRELHSASYIIALPKRVVFLGSRLGYALAWELEGT